MSHGDPLKWHMPGWRIEQRFAPGVLIGNWAEERYKFLKGNQPSNSTYRVDFTEYGGFRPDVILRRKAQIQNDGLGKEFLFRHHGNQYSNNMISWYDEHYNKRERDEKNKLPELRHWDSHSLSWVPEKTDFPIQGAPTNFGLHNKMVSDWSDGIEEATTNGDYNTTYRFSYSAFPQHGMVQTRYATPKHTSTSMHTKNAVNKDLLLRGTSNLQSPEIISSVSTPPSAPPMPAVAKS